MKVKIYQFTKYSIQSDGNENPGDGEPVRQSNVSVAK